MATEKQFAGGVDGFGVFSLKIDGENPPPSIGLVVSCNIIENPATIPCCQLELADRNNVLRNERALVDGTILTISMGPSLAEAETFTFRVTNVKERDADDGCRMLTVIAIIDKPKFLLDSRSWTIRGNSMAVLQTVCDDTDITFDTDVQTNDSMRWTSIAQGVRQFISTIERHAYKTDDSHIRTVLTADGRLICRDLTAQMQKDPSATLAFNTKAGKGMYQVHEFRPKSISGVMNGLTNYGEKIVWNSTDGKTNELSTMTHTSTDPLNVSSGVREQISGTRKTYVANSNDINVHSNWVKAEYLWRRNAASYTESARALILNTSPRVDIFSVIQMNAGLAKAKQDEAQDVKTSGKWIVMGKTRTYAQNRFSTLLLLTRNFTPVSGTSEIGGGMNIILTPFETVAALVRPYQLNLNISQILGELGPVEALAKAQEEAFAALKEQFKEGAEQFGFTELYEKYGEGKDALMSLLQEFNIARFLTGLCEGLNMLEKLSVNLVIELGPTILSNLANRMDKLEEMGDSFTRSIQALIDNGDIPAEYLNGPTINQRCVSNKLNDLQRNIDNALPDKCLDAFSIGRLSGPSIGISQLLRQLEEYLRGLLCSMGDGTVDGSSKNGTEDGLALDQYVPKEGWKLKR